MIALLFFIFIWIVSSVLAYGYTMGWNQRHYTTHWIKGEFVINTFTEWVIILIPIIGLTFIMTSRSQWKYGVKWRNEYTAAPTSKHNVLDARLKTVQQQLLKQTPLSGLIPNHKSIDEFIEDNRPKPLI